MTNQTTEGCEDLRSGCLQERRTNTRWLVGILVGVGVVLFTGVMAWAAVIDRNVTIISAQMIHRKEDQGRIEKKLDKIDGKLEAQATLITAFHVKP